MVAVIGWRTPGEVSALDLAGNSAGQTFAASLAGVDPATVRPQVAHYPAQNGVMLQGLLLSAPLRGRRARRATGAVPVEGHGWRKLPNELFYYRRQAEFSRSSCPRSCSAENIPADRAAEAARSIMVARQSPGSGRFAADERPRGQSAASACRKRPAKFAGSGHPSSRQSDARLPFSQKTSKLRTMDSNIR